MNLHVYGPAGPAFVIWLLNFDDNMTSKGIFIHPEIFIANIQSSNELILLFLSSLHAGLEIDCSASNCTGNIYKATIPKGVKRERDFLSPH